MKVQIAYIRFEFRGRPVAIARFLDESGNLVMAESTLGTLMAAAHERGYEIINAQEILDVLVRLNGFAA